MDARKLGDFKASLENLLTSPSEGGPTRLINQIRDLGLAMGHDAGEALLAAHPELLAYRARLTRAFRKMVTAQDVAEVEQLLAQAPDGSDSFKAVASRETNIGVMSSLEAYNRLDEIFNQVDFSRCRQVVVVGCGRRPFTMFHIHDETNAAKVIGLDTVPEAVEKANQLAAKFGYVRMHARLCDGRDFDYGSADVVYVTSMVTPKMKVVSRIADTAPEDAQVILWEPCSLSRLWMESVEPALDPRLQVIGRSSIWRNMTRDVFVRRRSEMQQPELGG